MRRYLAALATWLAMTAGGYCQQLPGSAKDLAFESFSKLIDLENPALFFTHKAGKHEGSSMGFHIGFDKRSRKWTFAPDNSSNNPESEIVSYRLSRVLGISNQFNPVTYYNLGPQASKRFKTLLRDHAERSEDVARLQNRAKTLAELNAHSSGLLGTFRIRVGHRKRAFVSSLTDGHGNFNRGSKMAGFIQAKGPVPGDALITFSEVKSLVPGGPAPAEKESELARQLSNIFLVDLLTGQWDRFVNNMEAELDDTGALKFVARDNGGATVNDIELGDWTTSLNPYNSWLSRYDRAVIERLEDLNDFLHGRQKTFDGFSEPEAWKKAIGFMKSSSFTSFKQKVSMLVEKKIPELEKQYAMRTYFAVRGTDAKLSERMAPPAPGENVIKSASAAAAPKPNAAKSNEALDPIEKDALAADMAKAEPATAPKPTKVASPDATSEPAPVRTRTTQRSKPQEPVPTAPSSRGNADPFLAR